MSDALLEVRDLRIAFPGRRDVVRAVDGLSFSIRAGETLAIVGESGSGKTVTGLSLMGLLPSAQIGGSALIGGEDILRLPPHSPRRRRGQRISMVFQDPMTALNPVQTIGAQIVEAIQVNGRMSRQGAAERALELLRQVHIPEPEARLREYPHRLSGGMRQRVVIAIALASAPALLIADEPTTALDVTIQAQILQLLVRLKEELGMSLILISHDLAVVAETADRVLVMYDGKAVEEQPVIDLFDRPIHSYTRALIAARPQPRPSSGRRPRLREVGDAAPARVVSLC